MRTLFAGGRVFDAEAARFETADVVIDGDRIVEVGSDLDGDTVVDCAGRDILPGFFDCHVHVTLSHIDIGRRVHEPYSLGFFEAVGNLSRTLRAGVTSVRDAGGADLGVKTAVEQGLIEGPRMQITIQMVSQTGGHGDGWLPSGSVHRFLFGQHPGSPNAIADGPDEIRRLIRTLLQAGADAIKVATSGGVLSPSDDPRHPHFRPEELAVLVAEADAGGVPVMAHAQATEGIKNAVAAGIRSIEHGIYLDDEAIDMMLERGTFLVPTLLAPRGVLDAAAAGAAIPEASVRKAAEVVDVHKASFRRAVEAGVNIALGTDSGVTPHGSNLRELALMVDGGMRPEAALRAGTIEAARLLRTESELGSIHSGKLADLVIVDGDASDVATLPERVVAVWKGGRLVG